MFTLLLVLSATFSICRAESITETSGKVYNDITVTRSTATHLTFTYKTADGMTAVAMVKRENLHESIQEKYGYEPSTADAQQTQQEPQPPDRQAIQPSDGKHAGSSRKAKPERPKSAPVATPPRVSDQASSSQSQPQAQPQAAQVRLTILSREPRIERDRSQPPVKFYRGDKLVDAFGNVQFKFELQNLTTNALKNLRFVITVLDKQGKLSVAPVNGGAGLDAKGKAEYSHEMMISYNEKSESRPVEAYSIDVVVNRKVLLTETYPAAAREMLDEKKSGSNDYGKWSGRPTPDGVTDNSPARRTK